MIFSIFQFKRGSEVLQRFWSPTVAYKYGITIKTIDVPEGCKPDRAQVERWIAPLLPRELSPKQALCELSTG